MTQVTGPVLFELNAYDMLKKIFSEILKLSPDCILVLPFASPSGPSHYRRNLFPSISVDIGVSAMEEKYLKLRNKKKHLFAIIPDYTIIIKDDISKIFYFYPSKKKNKDYIENTTIAEYENIIEKMLEDKRNGSGSMGNNKKRTSTWFFSEEMKKAVFEDKKRESGFRLLLKKDRYPAAVIDCKCYSGNVSRSDVEKLIFDAKLSGAKECYILTKNNRKVIGFNSEKISTKFDNEISFIKINDYKKPRLISRDEFNIKYQNITEKFNQDLFAMNIKI